MTNVTKCQDINECSNHSMNSCTQLCLNTEGIVFHSFFGLRDKHCVVKLSEYIFQKIQFY